MLCNGRRSDSFALSVGQVESTVGYGREDHGAIGSLPVAIYGLKRLRHDGCDAPESYCCTEAKKENGGCSEEGSQLTGGGKGMHRSMSTV